MVLFPVRIIVPAPLLVMPCAPEPLRSVRMESICK